jgi:hypothetical protein
MKVASWEVGKVAQKAAYLVASKVVQMVGRKAVQKAAV